MINLKKLLKENVEAPKTKLDETMDNVRSGIQKVFAAGGSEISYKKFENVGLAHIRGSVSEAFKTALKESRKLAKSFGYKDDENTGKFIKEENDFSKMSAEKGEDKLAQVQSHEQPHDETDMSNPEEAREVAIGREIKNLADSMSRDHTHPYAKHIGRIIELANELMKLHGAE